MLLELHIENFAIIDRLAVEFGPGLNLVTGETGAGKSILIDALSLLLGEKASPEMVRHGAERATLSAVFQSGDPAVAALLEANAFASDQELILRREIAANGRSRVLVNDQPATVSVLKQLSAPLINIHAQNQTLSSLDAAARLELLDTYADCDRQSLAVAYGRWKDIRGRMAELESSEQDRLRSLDLWRFQKQEIESARLQPCEDEALQDEKRVLANAGKIHSLATAAYDLLYEGETSAAACLRAASRQLQELARYSPQWQESLQALESARIAAEDIGASLRDYVEDVEASPARLAEVEDRLAVIERLKRKYGPTLAEVMAYGDEVSRKLDDLDHHEELGNRLRSELAAAGSQYLELARTLSRKRIAAARKLEKLVEAQVNELAMKAQFRIDISGGEEEERWTAWGFDAADFQVATNPGEPLAPLEKIASGGELSRIMLALKAAIYAPELCQGKLKDSAAAKGAKSSPARTLIFDEIDIGIGGRAAEAVGRKLKALASSAQVLCVTHLPQIAVLADHHYVIEKSEAGGRARATLRHLSAVERTHEIARMISGAKVTETSFKHAEQMLKTTSAT